MVIIWNAVPHTAAIIHSPGPFQAYRTDILTAVLITISAALTPIIAVPRIPGRDSRPAQPPSQCLLMPTASVSSASWAESLPRPSSGWVSLALSQGSSSAAPLVPGKFVRWGPGNGPGPLHGRISGYPQIHSFPILHRGGVFFLHFTGVADL
jgi:hypothetical protein